MPSGAGHDAQWIGELSHAELRRLVAGCGVAVVVDVLSFTTTVSVALDRGVEVVPHRWADDTAAQHGFSDVSHTLELFGTCSACRTAVWPVSRTSSPPRWTKRSAISMKSPSARPGTAPAMPGRAEIDALMARGPEAVR